MRRYSGWARGAVAAIAAATLTALACADPKEALLSAPDPDIIQPGDVQSPEGAEALRLGAISRLRTETAGGESAWLYGGLLVDEWKSSDTFLERNAIDNRASQDNNGQVILALRDIYRARSAARDALILLNQYKPNPPANIGQMYLVMALSETFLAENFCNGTPISEVVGGVPVYGPPLTNAAVFNLALAHLDSAITLTTATDAATVAIRNAVQVARGRVLANLGRFADAATTVASVPTAFRFDVTFSLTGGNNQIWSLNTSALRYTVGDSVDVSGIVKNALPFASAKDPRLPVDGSSTGTSSLGTGFDGATNFIRQRLFGRVDPTPVVSGLDARLIEAEAKLNANDIPGMTAILNALRSAPPTIANFSGTGGTPGASVPVTPTGLSPLATPATKDAAVTLFFREKAFWTFGRGQRLSDLRRQVRQYGRADDQVFPVGTFFKGGSYGVDVTLPIHPDEQNNTQFTACLDHKA
jgi:type II secretory pathway pseudopilin PulG